MCIVHQTFANTAEWREQNTSSILFVCRDLALLLHQVPINHNRCDRKSDRRRLQEVSSDMNFKANGSFDHIPRMLYSPAIGCNSIMGIPYIRLPGPRSGHVKTLAGRSSSDRMTRKHCFERKVSCHRCVERSWIKFGDCLQYLFFDGSRPHSS
jgi:hypothetical protein